MDHNQLESQKLAAEILISAVDGLVENLAQNDKLIEERKIAEQATSKLSKEFVSVLRRIQHEARPAASDDPDAQLVRISEFIDSMISSVEGSVKATSDELIRLEATQSGMARALSVVRETGESMLRNLSKIESLAVSDEPAAPRTVGERPESLPNVRNATSVKRSRESKNS